MERKKTKIYLIFFYGNIYPYSLVAWLSVSFFLSPSLFLSFVFSLLLLSFFFFLSDSHFSPSPHFFPICPPIFFPSPLFFSLSIQGPVPQSPLFLTFNSLPRPDPAGFFVSINRGGKKEVGDIFVCEERRLRDRPLDRERKKKRRREKNGQKGKKWGEGLK